MANRGPQSASGGADRSSGVAWVWLSQGETVSNFQQPVAEMQRDVNIPRLVIRMRKCMHARIRGDHGLHNAVVNCFSCLAAPLPRDSRQISQYAFHRIGAVARPLRGEVLGTMRSEV